MSSAQFKNQLKMANKTWKSAKEKVASGGGAFGDDIEDGRYKATVLDAELNNSQTSGRLQVAWTYQILEGEFSGKKKRDWDGCESEDNQVWLGRKLVRLGYEVPEDITDVEEILQDIKKSKIVVAITLKTKGKFQRVYIDRVLSGEEASGAVDYENEDLEEEAPSAEDVGIEEEESLEIGSLVSFSVKGEEVVGEVAMILEDEDSAKVKVGKKLYKVKADKLTLVDAEPEEDLAEEVVEEEEIPEEPAKKVTKKKPSKK